MSATVLFVDTSCSPLSVAPPVNHHYRSLRDSPSRPFQGLWRHWRLADTKTDVPWRQCCHMLQHRHLAGRALVLLETILALPWMMKPWSILPKKQSMSEELELALPPLLLSKTMSHMSNEMHGKTIKASWSGKKRIPTDPDLHFKTKLSMSSSLTFQDGQTALSRLHKEPKSLS